MGKHLTKKHKKQNKAFLGTSKWAKQNVNRNVNKDVHIEDALSSPSTASEQLSTKPTTKTAAAATTEELKSCCRYMSDKANGTTTYKPGPGLQLSVIKHVKPVFGELSSGKLLNE